MRFVPLAVAATALPLLLTACSSARTATAPSTAPSTPASTPSSADPDAGLPTGTQLKALLAPGSWFPSGFTLDRSGSVDTGSLYQQPSAPAGKPDCANLDATSWIQLGGVGSVSFAQNDYVDHDTSGQYAQEIDAFPGTGAGKVMARLRALARTCRSFEDQQTSSTVTVTLAKGPALGDDALAFRLDSPRWLGGTTLEAVRVGTSVITVFCSSPSGSGAAQATRLARLLTANLETKG